jgi:sugar diacid utilization regulator
LWATAVSAGGASLCALVLRPPDEPDAADLRILERAAMVTALLLLSRRSLAEAESRVRGELLDDLIYRPGTDPGTVWDRARRLGVDLAAPNAVLVLLSPGELRQRITAWAAAYAASHGGLAAYRDGCAVLLVPGEDPSGVATRVAREAATAAGVPVTVGAAGPVHAPDEVAAARREAARCAAALVALGRAGTGASGADLGFVGLLLGGQGTDGLDGFVTGVLGPVLEYDARRGTRLCRTLEAYFASGASPARAAEVLHVHVNTVAQRMERLTALLGAGWQRPERALDLQLALRLHRLRAQDPASSIPTGH